MLSNYRPRSLFDSTRLPLSTLDSSIWSPSFPSRMLSDVRSMFDLAPTTFNPAVDARETEDKYLFHVEVPGCRIEDMHVDLKDGALVISGNKSEHTKDEGSTYFHEERRYGSFTRSFAMPPEVTPNDVSASFVNGVLDITVNKPAGLQKSERIAIKGQTQPALSA